MLMPAAVLVLVAMAGVTVDAALVFLADRQLADAAAAAANDAVAAALDDAAFYEAGELRVDPDEARRVVAEAVAARSAAWLEPVQVVRVEVTAGPAVTVELAGQVRRLFGSAMPGVSERVAVGAAATATLEASGAAP